jgi:acetyl esterase/lipase
MRRFQFTCMILVLVMAVCGTASPLRAAQTDRATLPAPDSFLGTATFPLWDTAAPDAVGGSMADTPTITIFRPHFGTGNGTAVIVAPGGSYLGLAANLEGRQAADWFAARGVTAFVLKYRLGSRYLYPIPLRDAQRAIRLVRARAADFGIAPARIGMMGFSAGGHLTAAAGTMFDAGKPDAADPVERISSRPDFIILGYPWLNAMKADQKDFSYCAAMKVDAKTCASFEQYSPDRHVSAGMPPVFIYHTTDDELVPVDASVTFYRAVAAAGVPVEMHLFAKGRHGSGLGLGDAALDLWPALLEAWLRGRGLLTPDPAVTAETQRILTPPGPRAPDAIWSADTSIHELLRDPAAKAILVKHLGADYVSKELSGAAEEFRLRAMSILDPDHVTPAIVAAIDNDLRARPH